MKKREKIHPILLLTLSLITATSPIRGEIETPSSSVKFKFSDANPAARSISPASIPVESHFFRLGQQKSGRQRYEPKCAFKDIYPSIDFVCLGDEYAIEYIFLVHPGGDPSRVLLGFEKAAELNISNTGNITYQFRNIEITQSKPVVFERKKGSKVMLDGSYNAIAFESTVGLSPSKVFDEQISNEEFMTFLNDTESHPQSLRAAHMLFDEHGNAWMSESKGKDKGILFQINKSRLTYNDNKDAGERYTFIRTAKDSSYYKHRPIAGVSWYGAVKFSNWLTIINGYGIGRMKYKEGPTPKEWTTPPEEGWNTHFFNVAQSAPKQGFNVEAPYSSESDIEIHIFLNFYAATSAPDPIKELIEPTSGAELTDTPEAFIEQEGFISDKSGIIITAKTDEDKESKADNEQEAGADEATSPKGPRSGVLYKTQPGADADDQGDDDQGGGGGGDGSGVLPLVPPGPPISPANRIVTIGAANAPAGIFITASTPDINGLSSGTTPFTRTYDGSANITITYTAPAAEPSGNPFSKWQKNGVDYSTSQSINVLINDSMTLSAEYLPPPPAPWILTVNSQNPNSGVNITVTPDTDGDNAITTTDTLTYNNGTLVALVAAPQASGGNRFRYWQHGGGAFTFTENVSISITSDYTMTARYDLLRELTVNTTAPGGIPVTVTQDVHLKGSGNTTLVRYYDNGNGISVTAPNTAGNLTFQKWQRNGSDFGTALTANFAMNADYMLTAIYTYVPGPIEDPDPSPGGL